MLVYLPTLRIPFNLDILLQEIVEVTFGLLQAFRNEIECGLCAKIRDVRVQVSVYGLERGWGANAGRNAEGVELAESRTCLDA